MGQQLQVFFLMNQSKGKHFVVAMLLHVYSLFAEWKKYTDVFFCVSTVSTFFSEKAKEITKHYVYISIIG